MVGRPHPDWGEEVVAFVVVQPGLRVSEDELDAVCLANIARFKRPKSYVFVDALPKNNYGKVLKTALRGRPALRWLSARPIFDMHSSCRGRAETSSVNRSRSTVSSLASSAGMAGSA